MTSKTIKEYLFYFFINFFYQKAFKGKEKIVIRTLIFLSHTLWYSKSKLCSPFLSSEYFNRILKKVLYLRKYYKVTQKIRKNHQNQWDILRFLPTLLKVYSFVIMSTGSTYQYFTTSVPMIWGSLSELQNCNRLDAHLKGEQVYL